MSNKRFDRYPSLAARVRGMGTEQRFAVRGWHHAMLEGLRSFLVAWPTEAKSLGHDREAGLAALGAWLRTQEDVAGIITDPREADWCCAQGMAAYPRPCPQHVRIVLTPEDSSLGTVLRSPGTATPWSPEEERRVSRVRDYTAPGATAIKVVDRTPGSVGYYWRGIHAGVIFDDDNVRGWHWVAEVTNG